MGESGIEVSRVPADLVDYVFEQLAPTIERGLSHGAGDATTVGHLKESIKRGDMAMWLVHEADDIKACLVLSVRQFAAKTTVFVELVAGREMDSWLERIEGLLRDYRNLVGADTIEATCRHGLARRLKCWHRKAVLMELK